MAKRHGKKYADFLKQFNKNSSYEPLEAFELVKKWSFSKFEWTVEASIKTSANPKYNDQMIRSTVVLPNGTGKDTKVWAFVSDDKIQEAKDSGAEIVGNQDLLKDIKDWKINFDVLVTTQDMMKELASVAKILWPRWVMPSPKAWTVTNDLKWTISEIKKWRREFKLDKTGNIHCILWKTSFEAEKLKENLDALIEAINEAKPAGVKWKLVQKVVVSPTMWPGINVKI